MARSSMYVDVIDDANNRGIDGRGLAAERLARGAALDHDEHALADAGAHRVDRQHRHAARLVVERERLYEQQLRALELAMLLRRDDRADYAPDLHETFSSHPSDR